ncbi:hypothetical protein BSL78_01257 [Apostichopus japonicus]|uniref:Alanine--glyoxylate aminotransferase 2, mitochondrial n=1 Tax=Stichopus japonicus TaxID=307972 RepID=A0A2G8LNM1_STIJA|nr:hypothetical protein BSL78_01257 [Apostichopus japonicus]
MANALRHVGRYQLQPTKWCQVQRCEKLQNYSTSSVEEPAKVGKQPMMPPCDFNPTPFQGMPFETAKKVRQGQMFPGYAFSYYQDPLYLNQGHMQWLFDHTGRRYLDMYAGVMITSVGHCNPKINQVLHDQSELVWSTSNVYMHPRIHELADKLTSKLPSHLNKVIFTNSGSEANDLALHLMRLRTRNFDIISMSNAYHGLTTSLMGITALTPCNFQTPRGFGITNSMCPDVYTGTWGGKHCRDSPVQANRTCNCEVGSCQAKDNYISQFADVMKYSMPQKIAGFFSESIQGAGGTRQYPKGFLKEAFEIVRSKGGLCLADEVQTGLGRLGSHFWGFEHHDVMPDIVTIAKGIANGFPLAAVVTTEDVFNSLSDAIYFNTFGGSALGCSIGSAVLDYIEDNNTQLNSHTVGTYLLEQLSRLRDEFEIVGDVRGKGLMIGVELVENKETRQPLALEKTAAIFETIKDLGVLIGLKGTALNVFDIKPPMIITKEDADFTVDVIREAILRNQ